MRALTPSPLGALGRVPGELLTRCCALLGGDEAAAAIVRVGRSLSRALAAALWAGFSMTSALATGAPLSPRFAQ